MKIALSDLPDDIRKKIASENRIPRDEKSFQIYSSDLSRVFEIGEIVDMFVTVIDNKQVLRVRYYEEKKDDQYPTVKAPQRKRPAVHQTQSAKTPQKEQTFTQKIADGAKDFFLNPERNKGKFGGGF
jgi:hypothetical protein